MMVWVRQAARRFADASGAGDGLFLCWLYSEETGHGALLPLAIDTSPGRARRLADASEAARAPVPQSAAEWQRLSQSAALRGEGCDRPGVTRHFTIHDSFPSIRAGEATRADSALSPLPLWH